MQIERFSSGTTAFKYLLIILFQILSVSAVNQTRLDADGFRNWILSLAQRPLTLGNGGLSDNNETGHTHSKVIDNLTKIPLEGMNTALNVVPVLVDTLNPFQLTQYTKHLIPHRLIPHISTAETEADAETVTFTLYTNNANSSDHDVLQFNDTNSLLNSRFKYGKPVKVLIHGFRRDSQWIFPQLIKNRYLEEKNGTIHRNILVVGWAKLAAFSPLLFVPGYATAALRNVPIVGQRVGQLLSFFVEHKRTRLDLIHFVGHSLGSHVAGVAGEYLHAKYGSPCARITGLDPAGPLFYSQMMGRPLSIDDAAFVDVVHTSQGTYGKMGQIGHADFFPNGGSMVQEGCRGNGTLAFGLGVLTDVLSLGQCSHSSAFLLFAKSIGTTSFVGCKCPNYGFYRAGFCDCRDEKNVAVLGENCDPKTRGSFYLDVAPWMEQQK